jgi:sulfite reductase beta subunit-like hemoprotein
LRVNDNRVLKGIFGPEKEEVRGGWRRLHNAELHNLHTSQNIIRVIKSRRMRWAGQVARMEEMRNSYNISVGKPEGKRPRGRTRRRWRIILERILGK